MLTVLEAGDQLLTTVSTARQAGIVDDVAEDPEIERLIGVASGTIARYCNRVFGRRSLRQVCRPGPRAVILDATPVVAVTSVSADGQALAPEDYDLDPAAGLLYRLDLPCGTWGGRVVVEYAAGWNMPAGTVRDLPHEIEQACLLTMADMLATGGRDPRLRSESVEGVGAASWLDPRAGYEQLPPQAVGLLAAYRRVSV